MLRTITSLSSTMTLKEVIAHITNNKVVDGVVLFGSVSKGTLTDASDYDICVILSEMPAPLSTTLTYIEQRLTDVIFLSTTFLKKFLADEAIILSTDSFEGSMLRRIPTGNVVFDPHKHLEQVIHKVQAGRSITTGNDSEIYATAFNINYNVVQTRRILRSTDPVYSMTVDIRLLYSIVDLWTGYFRLRKIPWSGEKEAIRYMTQHDPAYLALFQQYMAETNRVNKVELYERMAQLTLAPVGGLWQDKATAIQFMGGTQVTSELVTNALAFWQRLVTDQQT